jgi:sigma-B regulation protein RsbU (phosphoserine phosphatase)
LLTFTLNCVKVALPLEASLAINGDSWKTIWLPRLRQLLEAEQRVVFAGVLVSALIAVLIPGAPILFMGICTLTVGNLMYFLQTTVTRFHSNRPFPWNWVIYLPILTAGSLAGTLVSVAMVRWTRTDIAPYWEVFRHIWKIIMAVSLVAGIVGYAVQGIQRKLQAKNKLLEQAVERSTAALAQQEQELIRACEIQSGLLPKVLPQHPNLELAGSWQPARTVGGDYFDVVQLDEDRLGICIGDVSGKGLTASLLMANLQAAFRAYATPEATPAAVCAKLNAFVCGNVASDKFITFFYAIMDAQNRTLVYENAGHCPALLLHRAGAPESLCGQGGVLGVDPEWTYADSNKQLVAGDRLLLFTDGVTEAENQEAVEFGSERIVQVAGPSGSSAAETKRRVMEEVAKFCNGDFRDDVTLVVAAVQ